MLFVGHFKDADGMVAELDRDKEDVADHLVQLLVHGHVVAQLVAN